MTTLSEIKIKYKERKKNSIHQEKNTHKTNNLTIIFQTHLNQSTNTTLVIACHSYIYNNLHHSINQNTHTVKYFSSLRYNNAHNHIYLTTKHKQDSYTI